MITKERFWNIEGISRRIEGMRGMELHFEVIRDKETIYEQLLQSKSMGQELAVCYKTDNNLIVKICHVGDVSPSADGVQITLRSKPGDGPESNETTDSVIGLEKIESIYPIHAFRNHNVS